MYYISTVTKQVNTLVLIQKSFQVGLVQTVFELPLRAFIPPEHFVVVLWYDLDPVITVCSHRLAPNPVAI